VINNFAAVKKTLLTFSGGGQELRRLNINELVLPVHNTKAHTGGTDIDTLEVELQIHWRYRRRYTGSRDVDTLEVKT
jgi:hypothetical protein